MCPPVVVQPDAGGQHSRVSRISGLTDHHTTATSSTIRSKQPPDARRPEPAAFAAVRVGETPAARARPPRALDSVATYSARRPKADHPEAIDAPARPPQNGVVFSANDTLTPPDVENPSICRTSAVGAVGLFSRVSQSPCHHILRLFCFEQGVEQFSFLHSFPTGQICTRIIQAVFPSRRTLASDWSATRVVHSSCSRADAQRG